MIETPLGMYIISLFVNFLNFFICDSDTEMITLENLKKKKEDMSNSSLSTLFHLLSSGGTIPLAVDTTLYFNLKKGTIKPPERWLT